MSGRARGFTLVEVLVALAIVAIGMATVMSALSSSANTLIYMRDRTFAQWVALNQIANLRLSGQQPATGDSNGDTDYAGRSWHWRQVVAATEIPGVVRIDVSVRPAQAKGDDESGWFATVTGISGDAIGKPDGFNPSWGVQVRSALPNGGNPIVPINTIPTTPPSNPAPTPGPGPKGPG